MNPLGKTIDAMKKSLTRRSPEWAEGCARHPVLAQFGEPATLVSALGGALDEGVRNEITGALLSERRHGAATVWSSLLVVAFEPMLQKLRRGFYPRRDEDIDQDVLVAFLDATLRVAPGPWAARGLHLATLEPLRDARRRNKKAPKWVSADDEEEGLPDPDAVHGDRSAMVHLAEVAERVGGPALVKALAGALALGSMRDYVDATYPPRERASAYRQLCEARNELVAALNRPEIASLTSAVGGRIRLAVDSRASSFATLGLLWCRNAGVVPTITLARGFRAARSFIRNGDVRSAAKSKCSADFDT